MGGGVWGRYWMVACELNDLDDGSPGKASIFLKK
jgi:hypothetical protein